jgi:hypothetical protein
MTKLEFGNYKDWENLEVAALANKLPIQGEFSGLMSRLSLRAQLSIFGPYDGKISYSFVYKKGIHRVKIGSHAEYKQQLLRGQSRGYEIIVPVAGTKIVSDYGFCRTKEVVAGILRFGGLLTVTDSRYLERVNPFAPKPENSHELKSLENFQMTFPNEITRFTQYTVELGDRLGK